MVLIGVPPFQIEIPDDFGQGQKQITKEDLTNLKKKLTESVFKKVTEMTAPITYDCGRRVRRNLQYKMNTLYKPLGKSVLNNFTYQVSP